LVASANKPVESKPVASQVVDVEKTVLSALHFSISTESQIEKDEPVKTTKAPCSPGAETKQATFYLGSSSESEAEQEDTKNKQASKSVAIAATPKKDDSKMFSLSSENESDAEEELKEAIKHKKEELITDSQLDLLSTKTILSKSKHSSSSSLSSSGDESDSSSSLASSSNSNSSTPTLSSSSAASLKNKKAIDFSPAMDSKTEKDLLGFSLSEDEEEEEEEEDKSMKTNTDSMQNEEEKEAEQGDDENNLVNISDICRKVEMSTSDNDKSQLSDNSEMEEAKLKMQAEENLKRLQKVNF
jgi:hypothetical protein